MIFFAIAVSFFLTLGWSSLVFWAGRDWKLFKGLQEQGSGGVTKLGGAAMVASFFMSSYLILPAGFLIFSECFFLGILSLVFLLGLVDDVFRLTPFPKLVCQVLLAVLFSLTGLRTDIAWLPLWLNFVLTVLWFVSVMNAVNFLDILDGLAAGIVVTCSAAFLCISLLTGNVFAAFSSALLCGVNTAFLFFNRHPAKLYMGDSGSLFNGAALAGIAIMPGYAVAGREVTLFVPLLILALPLYDLVYVVLMRRKACRPVVKKSRDHFVLRLIDSGLSVPRTIFFMQIFNLAFVVAALLLFLSTNAIGAFILAVVVFLWSLVAHRLSRRPAHSA